VAGGDAGAVPDRLDHRLLPTSRHLGERPLSPILAAAAMALSSLSVVSGTTGARVS